MLMLNTRQRCLSLLLVLWTTLPAQDAFQPMVPTLSHPMVRVNNYDNPMTPMSSAATSSFVGRAPATPATASPRRPPNHQPPSDWHSRDSVYRIQRRPMPAHAQPLTTATTTTTRGNNRGPSTLYRPRMPATTTPSVHVRRPPTLPLSRPIRQRPTSSPAPPPSSSVSAWDPRNKRYRSQQQQYRRPMVYGQEGEAAENSEEPLSIAIVESPHDEHSIYEAAKFLVDAFWLDSRHLISQPYNPLRRSMGAAAVSQRARRSLLERQASDLMERYGDRVGQRILDNCVLKAVDTKTREVLGMVCVSALLFDQKREELLIHEDSEEILRAAVASLGPKDRRRYKNSSANEITSNLFGREMVAVCCISNLAVSPKARRLGLAKMLCDEAERIASVEWGYDAMVLKVEADNVAARNLYERRLQYQVKFSEASAMAFRVDPEDGRFIESEADTLVLAKDI